MADALSWDEIPELFTCVGCRKLRHKTWLRFVGMEFWCSMCLEASGAYIPGLDLRSTIVKET